MNWPRQVLHVVRSDARSLWPFFALHLAVLGYGVLQARGDAVVRDGLNTGPLYLYGSAMLYAALLMHRHMPDAPAAHWSSLPYDRSAVWAAKWSALAMLLAFAMGATAWAIRSLPFSEESALSYALLRIASLAGAVACAALVGAAARQLRTVLLLLISLPVMSYFVLLLLLVVSSSAEATMMVFGVLGSPASLLLGIAIAVCGSLWMYGSRRLSRLSRTGVIAGCALLFAMFSNVQPAAVAFSAGRSAAGADTTLVPESLRNVIIVATPTGPPAPSGAIPLRLRMQGAPSDLRARWTSTSKRVDSSAMGVSWGASSSSHDLHTPSVMIAPGFSWLGASAGGPPFHEQGRGEQWSVQTENTRDAQGPRKMTAAVSFSRPVVIATLPLASGQQSTIAGREFRIQVLGGGELICQEDHLAQWCGLSYPARSLVRLQLRTLESTPEDVEFALVNRRKREAIRMQQHATRSRSLSFGLLNPSNMRSTEWLLIPGTHPGHRAKDEVLPIDESWLRDAELVIVEWVPVGEIPVTIVNDSSRASSERR